MDHCASWILSTRMLIEDLEKNERKMGNVISFFTIDSMLLNILAEKIATKLSNKLENLYQSKFSINRLLHYKKLHLLRISLL